jgi:hypothetical protein
MLRQILRCKKPQVMSGFFKNTCPAFGIIDLWAWKDPRGKETYFLTSVTLRFTFTS